MAARDAAPPLDARTLDRLAVEIDQFTQETRDPQWCQDLAEHLAPLIARQCSTEAVLDDVRALRRQQDDQAAPVTPGERLVVLCGLINRLGEQITAGLPVEPSYALLVAVATVAVRWAESLTAAPGTVAVEGLRHAGGEPR